MVVTEEFTTRTCGHVRAAFKGKTFVCPACGMTADRDVSGARNVLLRHL